MILFLSLSNDVKMSPEHSPETGICNASPPAAVCLTLTHQLEPSCSMVVNSESEVSSSYRASQNFVPINIKALRVSVLRIQT